ncbi:hypothetical protein ACFWIO_20320, partial [Streptomyces diastatochromogenes]|uniref:hypothetical protein n=1 Tax=Streptomyces diastatochromogenes TaxID=42236 RepID=UPI003662466D
VGRCRLPRGAREVRGQPVAHLRLGAGVGAGADGSSEDGADDSGAAGKGVLGAGVESDQPKYAPQLPQKSSVGSLDAPHA